MDSLRPFEDVQLTIGGGYRLVLMGFPLKANRTPEFVYYTRETPLNLMSSPGIHRKTICTSRINVLLRHRGPHPGNQPNTMRSLRSREISGLNNLR